ncbi:MAG: hypothetical protein ACKOJF_33240, partial [Planctomycetaceae bacterium]
DGRLELYNLQDDLGETRNLAEEKPERTRELKARLDAWRRSIKAPLPQENTEREPVPEKEPAKTSAEAGGATRESEPVSKPETKPGGGTKEAGPGPQRRGQRRTRSQRARQAEARQSQAR